MSAIVKSTADDNAEKLAEPVDLDALLAELAQPINIRPVRRLTQAALEAYLEKAADILRGSADHSEFRGYVFALLFYKRISDRYEEELAHWTKKLGGEAAARDPGLHNFVIPEDTRWQTVVRTPQGRLGQALNEAMIAVERANAPKFDGILTNKIDFNKSDELPRAKLVSLINHFSSQTMDEAHVPADVFGNAYEYLIRNFASKAGKSSGEFYTPAEVGFLMSEMIEPNEGQHICDWVSGSGGLLLQCIRYLKERGKDPKKLFLHAQESNVATHNISRINMILHGIQSWDYARLRDSLRDPEFRDEDNQLKRFDRVIMNPPFSLEDWGYADIQGGDPYERMAYGMPPDKNGDYAWLQHVAKSLKAPDTAGNNGGKAIIVMSQGVLFRGQPEQTMEEDGRNQKADAEYCIRRGFIEDDLIGCVVVLPSKLFYGNGVPACLVVLNKSKPAARRNKILMIWAARHFQKSNPQNLLRPSDLMRILMPWRAFGDLEHAQALVREHHAALQDKVEADRSQRLQDIEDAYGPVLAPLTQLRAEQAALAEADIKVADVWEAIAADHPYYAPLHPLKQAIEAQETAMPALQRAEKKAAREQLKAAKAEYKHERKVITEAVKARRKQVNKAVTELDKLRDEHDNAVAEINQHADREIAHLWDAADDLLRICADPDEARRYFAVVDNAEVEENEHNLNLPRYVDTFEPEEQIVLADAIADLKSARKLVNDTSGELYTALSKFAVTQVEK